MAPPRRARPVDPSILASSEYDQSQPYGQQQHEPAGFLPSPEPQSQQYHQQQQQPDHQYGGGHQQGYYPPQDAAQSQQYYAPSSQHRQPPHQSHPFPAQHEAPQMYQSHSSPNHINPPPASTPGREFAGASRMKIDHSQVPSPTALLRADQAKIDEQGEGWSGIVGFGEEVGMMPLSGSEYRGIDMGNSTPAHLRLTTYSVPASHDLLTSTHIPFGLVCQPFHSPREDENPVPLVTSFGNSGPPRCGKCRAYVNVWCRWVRGGERWVCNLCGGENETPQDYYSHLEAGDSSRRMDADQRPELCLGTVDFLVGSEYYSTNPPPSTPTAINARPSKPSNPSSQQQSSSNNSKPILSQSSDPTTSITETTTNLLDTLALAGSGSGDGGGREQRRPRALHHLFALDVGWNASSCGLIQEWCESLRAALYVPEGSEGGSEGSSVVVVGEEESSGSGEKKSGGCRLAKDEKIGIVTFDSSIHFWDLAAGKDAAEMRVMLDLEDVFIPLPTDLIFVDPHESRSTIESLLTLLPTLFAQQPQSSLTPLGTVVQSSLLALASLGGSLSIFQTSLPNSGPGALKPRDETKLAKTDKEKTLFVPQEIFWRNLAEECVDLGVGVNLWLFPAEYVDVASLSILPSLSGGDLIYIPKFDPVRAGGRLRATMEASIHREMGYNATMRIRCSTGLRSTDSFGSFHQRSLTDLEFGSLSSSSTVATYLQHDGPALSERSPAAFQVAILYTARNGERRVRVLNLQVPVTTLVGNVFRYGDLDAVTTLLFKEAIGDVTRKMLPDVRTNLTRRAVQILTSYRKNCSLSTAPGQLVLPDSFNLLPLYTLCMLKSKPLKGGNVIADVRVAYMRFAQSLGVAQTLTFLYPRMVAVHVLEPHHGFAKEDGSGRIELPPLNRCTYSRVEPHGAYLLLNGEVAILWLGASVSPQILNDLFGVDDLADLDARMASLPRLPTHLSTQLRNILAHYSMLAGRELSTLIARQNMDGSELEFGNMLVEDKVSNEVDYPSYLMQVHQAITKEQREGGEDSAGGASGAFSAVKGWVSSF